MVMPAMVMAQSTKMANGRTLWKVWCSECGILEKPQKFYEPEDPKIMETRDKHRAWHKEIEE